MAPIRRLLAALLVALVPATGQAQDARIVLFEDPALGPGRLHYPLLISNGRGYRIHCATEVAEEAVIRGLGFASVPGTVLTAVDPDIVTARPEENPLLCPTAPDYPIKVFRSPAADGIRYYLQFPTDIGSPSYGDRLFVPQCTGLAEALHLDLDQALAADPTPFFQGKIHPISCLSGTDFVDTPTTFTDWCVKQDRTAAQTATVMALLDATPGGISALGNATACGQADAFLRAVTSLNLDNRGVQSVEPISALTHLTRLILSHNSIADLTPMTRMTALTYLDLSGNRIANVTALTPLTALLQLDLSDNQLTNIRALSALPLLTALHLDGNAISDLTPLQFHQTLSVLSLARNQLTGSMLEPLTGLSALTTLDLSDNQIADFEHVATFPSTVQIVLGGNPIVSEGGQTFVDSCILHRDAATPYGQTIRALLAAAGDGTCVQANTALMAATTLDLSSKIISDVRPLALLDHLTNLNLSSNAITDIVALSRLTRLRSLNLAENDIRDIRPVAALAELTTFDATGNPVELNDFLSACLMRQHADVLDHEQSVEVEALLDVSGATTCARAEADLNGRAVVAMPGAGLTSLAYFRVLQNVDTLDLSGNGLSDVAALEGNPRLTRLNLRENNMASLASLRRLRGLEALNLARNPINGLAGLTDLSRLTRIDLSETGVRSVGALADLPRLEAAVLRDMPLDYASLGEYCLVNRFDPLALGAVRPFMEAIDALLDAAQVNRADCPAVEAWAAGVTVLNLNKKQIVSLAPIIFFPALTELHLYDNLISDAAPVASLRNLSKLNLSTNRLNAIPRLGSTGLRELYLNANLIADISPVDHLHALASLSFLNNRVEQITALAGLSQLGSIDARQNRIQNFGQLVEAQLPRLYLRDNPICVSPFTMHPMVQEACDRGFDWRFDHEVVIRDPQFTIERNLRLLCPAGNCVEHRLPPNIINR